MLRSQLSAPMDSYLDSHIDPRSLTRGLLGLVILLMLSAWPRTALAQTGVSDDRVSLPEGPGSLEGVGENVEIDPNMGQMRYGVSIKVPSGYPGMTPALALSYSSGAGGSVVGMGWSLAMPNIERTTARGLPDYDVDDEFAANGSDQLVRVSNGPEPVYRARFEKAFIRYKWHDRGDGSEGYWTAEHPDGRISYYGATSDGTLVDSARVSGITGTFRYHLVETVDPYGHKLVYDYSLFGGNVTLLQHIGWVFDDGQPVYEASFQYSDRSDLLSDCKAGFNELLSKRLDRINVLAHGTRIRYYALTYEDYASSGGFSRLTAVQMYGKDGNPYPVHETFSYSQGLGAQCDGSDCQKPYMTSMGSIGGGLGAGKAALIDLNGDALPDIVDASQPGAHRIHLNQLAADGSHSFAAPFDSAVGTQASHGLGGSAYVQVLDADGDGRTDMLNVQTGQILKNLGDGDWDAQVVSLWDSNNIPFSEAEMATMHFIDYDNDKRIDLIRSQGSGLTNITTVYRNTESGAFVVDTNVEDIGAGFDTDKIELNDMNGDGLLDAVQVSLSEVRFWLNLGKGRWDAQATIPNVSFTDIAQATRAELEDLNGDALADLVLVEGNEIKYWLNRNGASFDPVQTVVSANVDGELPVRDATTVVLFADMNGNGSSDVVWIDATGNVNYLELFPVRPNLMSKIENGLGKISTITYGTSVMDMARDKELGEPWSHALPSPMMVVERYDEWNALTDIHETTDYLYHEGFYDGLEKQFRGFIRVEQVEPGDEHSEDGMLLDVYDVGDVDPYRNGLLLQREIQGEAGRSLQLTTTTYGDCAVDGIVDSELSYDVRYICKTAETVEQREAQPASDWVTTEQRWDYDGYGNVILASELGVTSVGGGACAACASADYDGRPCGAQCLGDESYTATEYASPPSNADRWFLRNEIRKREYGVADASAAPANAQYSETLTYYDGEDFVGLPHGQISHGGVARVVKRVNTDGDTVVDTRNKLDAHGNVIETLDPLGSVGGDTHRRVWNMDALGLKVLSTELLLSDATGAYRLRRDFSYDAVFDQLETATDWILIRDGNEQSPRNESRLSYDNFARRHTMTRPDEAAGFATETYTWALGSPVSKVTISARSQAGGSEDYEHVICFDGRGRKFQERTRLRAGLYRVSGLSRFNTRGHPVEVFQHYESDSADCDTSPAAGTLSELTRYDAMGREIEQTLPDINTEDGEEARTRITYLPLQKLEYDPEDTFAQGEHTDTPTRSIYNGQKQKIAVEEVLEAGGTALRHQFAYDALGNLSAVIDPAGNTRRLRYDLLGRQVEDDDPDRGLTRTVYDAAGNRIQVTDATDKVWQAEYDGANRILTEWDAADAEATRLSYHYDSAEHCAIASCTNLAGRLAETHFPLGGGETGAEYFGYDSRGKESYLGRLLDGHLFEFETLHDNMGRVLANVFPNGVQFDYVLNGAGQIASVPGYIDDVQYSPRGNMAELRYASGVELQVARDAQNRVSAIQATGPDSDLLLDYRYQRDREGNILRIEDQRADDGAPSGNVSYRYDALYRLVEARHDSERAAHSETMSYAFDVTGNLIDKSSSLGGESAAQVGSLSYGGGDAGPHAVTEAGAISYLYDAAGRRIQQGELSLAWDIRGRLSSITDATGQRSSYVYSTGRERLIKREGGGNTYYVSPSFEVRDGVATTYLEIDSQRVAKIEDPSFAAQILSDLAPASGDDSALLAQPDGSICASDAWMAQALGEGVLEFSDAAQPSSVESLLTASVKRMLTGETSKLSDLLHDQMGSTVAVTDETGALVQRFAYYAFGGERYASAGPQDYGYSGRERDVRAGLLYYGGRYLDPFTGTWTQPDPQFNQIDDKKLSSPVELSNPYSFSRGNPVNVIDKDGHLAFLLTGAIGAMVGLVRGIVKAVNNGVGSAAKGIITKSIGKGIKTGSAISPIGGAVYLSKRNNRYKAKQKLNKIGRKISEGAVHAFFGAIDGVAKLKTSISAKVKTAKAKRQVAKKARAARKLASMKARAARKNGGILPAKFRKKAPGKLGNFGKGVTFTKVIVHNSK